MPSRPPVAIAEFSVSGPEAGPYGITAGPDGALWFTMVHHGRIGRITPDGEVTVHQLEPASGGPSIITAGPDDALWFTEFRSHRIGRITTSGSVTSFPLPTPDAGPFGITVVPTTRCGSPRPTPTASAASPPTGRSPSSPSAFGCLPVSRRRGPGRPAVVHDEPGERHRHHRMRR